MYITITQILTHTHQCINVCKYQCNSIFVYSEKTLFFKRNPKDMLGAFCCFLNLCCYLKTCIHMQSMIRKNRNWRGNWEYNWHIIVYHASEIFSSGSQEKIYPIQCHYLLISNHQDNGRRINCFNITTFIIFLIEILVSM